MQHSTMFVWRCRIIVCTYSPHPSPSNIVEIIIYFCSISPICEKMQGTSDSELKKIYRETERIERDPYEIINKWDCEKLLDHYKVICNCETTYENIRDSIGNRKLEEWIEGKLKKAKIILCMGFRRRIEEGKCQKSEEIEKIISEFTEAEYKAMENHLIITIKLANLEENELLIALKHGPGNRIYDTFKNDILPIWSSYMGYICGSWDRDISVTLWGIMKNESDSILQMVRNAATRYINEDPAAVGDMFSKIEKGTMEAMEAEVERRKAEKETAELATKFEEMYQKGVSELMQHMAEMREASGEKLSNIANELDTRLKNFENEWADKLREIEGIKNKLEEKAQGLEQILAQRQEMNEREKGIIEMEIAKLRETNREYQKMLDEHAMRVSALAEEKSALEKKVKELTTYKEEGAIVEASEARAAEIEWIEKIRKKVENLMRQPIYDPLKKKEFDADPSIKPSILVEEDEREDLPKNECIIYDIVEKTYLLSPKYGLKVMGKVCAHLEAYKHDNYDALKGSVGDILRIIEPLRQQIGTSCTIVGIGSPTGWDEGAISFVKNFSSSYLSVCLVDLLTDKIYYNSGDDKLKRYAHCFTLTDYESEENKKVRECKQWILDNISKYSVFVKEIPLEYVRLKGKFSPRTVRRAAWELENENRIKLRHVEKVGLIASQENW